MAKLTMKEFAWAKLVAEGEYNINRLASEWYEYKNDGRYPPASSRRRFGTTSAAYKTAYKLRDQGLVNIYGSVMKLIQK